MIILGVDPGTLVTGYGVVESHGGKVSVLGHDAIKNDSHYAMPYRLKRIFDTLCSVIDQYHPNEFAIETAFYGKNAQSALKLGHARGAALLSGVSRNIPTYEYSPREVKKGIVGNGTASKQQVQYMVKSLLHLKEFPKEYDTTDALAVAVCHLHRTFSTDHPQYTSWKAFLTVHPEKISPLRRKNNL